MWRIKNRSCMLLLLLVLCFLPALRGSSVQAEVMYQISEGELNQLQNNLTELKGGQRAEAESLDRAAEAASNSQRAVGEIQKIERRDADLISGSEEILQRVRERGGTEN